MHDRAWREYDLLVGLYRYYLELSVRVAGGYFLIVGGVLTLVLANSHDEPIVIAALAAPLALTFVLLLVARKVRPRVGELRDGIEQLGESIGVIVLPHVEILDWAISSSAVLLSVALLFLTGLAAWLTLVTLR
jgi:hypothetical protein